MFQHVFPYSLPKSFAIEVLNGCHVAWQEQKILFPTRKEVFSYAKHFHCSCHATWLPSKTSIAGFHMTSLKCKLQNY